MVTLPNVNKLRLTLNVALLPSGRRLTCYLLSLRTYHLLPAMGKEGPGEALLLSGGKKPLGTFCPATTLGKGLYFHPRRAVYCAWVAVCLRAMLGCFRAHTSYWNAKGHIIIVGYCWNAHSLSFPYYMCHEFERRNHFMCCTVSGYGADKTTTLCSLYRVNEFVLYINMWEPVSIKTCSFTDEYD